jgi:hypothetical protein
MVRFGHFDHIAGDDTAGFVEALRPWGLGTWTWTATSM